MKEKFKQSLRPLGICALITLALALFLELTGHRTLAGGLGFIFGRPHLFLVNYLLILPTLCLSLLFKRQLFVRSVVSLLWFILGATNFVIILERGTPLSAVDFTIFTDCLSILTIYLTPLVIVGILAALVMVVVLLTQLFIRGKKTERSLLAGFLILLAAVVLASALCFAFIRCGLLPTRFDNLTEGFEENGYVYSFGLSLFGTGIEEPEDYSKASISSILAELEPEGIEPEIRPNILFFQMESFMDPLRIKGVTISEDPIPNFRRLRDKGTGGALYVSTIGGGTANTEFEVLTGIDLELFGPGEYPYTTVLKDSTCETVCYDLSAYGYTSHAFHNHSGNFYGRNTIFSQLGFDDFTSVEYMTGKLEKTPVGWEMDSILPGEIFDAMQMTDGPDFVYTISVEGHAKYPSDVAFPGKITALGDRDDMEAFTYYLNVVADMDRVLGDLYDAVMALDEPTILVAYGDHLPALSLSEDTLVDGDPFASEYLIIANYDLTLPSDTDLEAFQLTAHVLETAGFEGGFLTRLYARLSGSPSYTYYMQTLAYDMLYGECECCDGIPPHRETPMTMGFRPVKITDAYIEDGDLHIRGEHFTEFSSVCVGNWRQNTEFIDGTHLVCPDTWLFLSDHISVAQYSDVNVKLSSTESIPVDSIREKPEDGPRDDTGIADK